MAEGAGVTQDKELKLEETEVSHTLGGAGEGRVQGRGKWRGCRGAWRQTGCGLASAVSAVRYT